MAPASEISYDGLTTLAVSFAAEGVLHVVLNRPNQLNAMSPAFWREFEETFRKIARDPRVLSVVISANGRLFTAGLDLKASGIVSPGSGTGGGDVARKAFHLREEILATQEPFNWIERCGKPVVVAIHSKCVGGGVDLASACDIRYCSEDSEFTIKEVDVGLAADVGTLARFPRIVGNDSVVRELAYTARWFGAKEAKEIGFIGRVLPTKEAAVQAAIETATVIASKSPVAVQGTKHNLLYNRDHSVEEGNRFVANWNAFALQSEDVGKAVMASLAKKKATFARL
ncbi:dienoyl-CoA isomerase [Hyaloraphidium curvatum]|nr:dienoyl-CoA isomerase [Hyaloraphidium curvatum]